MRSQPHRHPQGSARWPRPIPSPARALARGAQCVGQTQREARTATHVDCVTCVCPSRGTAADEAERQVGPRSRLTLSDATFLRCSVNWLGLRGACGKQPTGTFPSSHGTVVGLREGAGGRRLSGYFMKSRARGQGRRGPAGPGTPSGTAPGRRAPAIADAAASGPRQCRAGLDRASEPRTDSGGPAPRRGPAGDVPCGPLTESQPQEGRN